MWIKHCHLCMEDHLKLRLKSLKGVKPYFKSVSCRYRVLSRTSLTQVLNSEYFWMTVSRFYYLWLLLIYLQHTLQEFSGTHKIKDFFWTFPPEFYVCQLFHMLIVDRFHLCFYFKYWQTFRILKWKIDFDVMIFGFWSFIYLYCCT